MVPTPEVESTPPDPEAAPEAPPEAPEETVVLPPTTAEIADELFQRLPDAAARDELVLLFRPLARYLARRFAGRGEPVEDLEQVASIALIKAVDRFDRGREVKFSTYATVTIVGELKRHFRDKGWALNVPRRVKEISLHVERAVSELNQMLGHSPTVKEIAEYTGSTEEEVVEGIEAMHAYSTTPLDAPTDEDKSSPLNRLSIQDDSLEVLESWVSVKSVLKTLPDRDRKILHLRFFKGMTQTQIAAELGISQMHVSRLLSGTLRKVRDRLGPMESPSANLDE
ncbi:MAG TPA: SigB/SigF/SigG family RNA polymerase sigma factor [Actinomycetota bacterium]|nr:SigB/SigF/SigG family RNA polymerase sigma factor [Actinomycetota bacterium]